MNKNAKLAISSNRPLRLTEADYRKACDMSQGYCRQCGEVADRYVEPDATEYPCDACGAQEVYGAEELLVRGEIEFK